MKVKLGKLLITTGASEKLDMEDVISSLIKHQQGQWGDIPLSDALSNLDSLEHGGRVMSVWYSRGVRYWIITEPSEVPGCTVTTILLPDEY